MSTIDKPTDSATDKPAVVPARNEFLEQSQQQQPGLVREFWDFLKYNKAWWLTPIILVLLLVGVLAGLAATGAAPFIYAIF